MNKEQLKDLLKLTGESQINLQGEKIDSKLVYEIILNKVWRTAIVNKNVREADKGGIKAVVSKALNAKLIDANEALTIILTNDKSKTAELLKQLPQNEKTEEPNAEDIERAIVAFLQGKGQNDQL